MFVICVVLPAMAAEDIYSPYSPDAYTRGLWHFDQAYGDTIFDDASANGNWGTLETGKAYERSGAMTWATSMTGFDTDALSSGVNKGPMEVPQGYWDGTDTNNSLAFGSGTDMTIEFWMRPVNSGNYYRRILQKNTADDYGVEWKNNTIRFICYKGGWQTVASADTCSLNVWTHVAIMLDRTTSDTDRIAFYYNGQIGSEGWQDAPWSGHGGNPSSNSLWIGGRHDANNSSMWYGELDEVRISDTLRDYGDLIPSSDVLQPDEHTRGLWYFNQLPGQTSVIDASANDNDGTLLTGFTYELDPNTSWDTSQPGYNNCVKTWWNSSVDYNLGPIEVPQSASKDSLAFSPGTDMVIEFWMNPSAYPPTGKRYNILMKYTGGDYSVSFSSEGKLRYGWWGGSAWRSVTDVTVIPLNQWTQVAITVDRSSDGSNDYISFYINNSLSSAHTTPHKGGGWNTESLWILGRWDGHIDYCYRGKLDELKISDAFPDYLPPLEINWIKKVGDDVQFEFNSRMNSFYKIYSANSPGGSLSERQSIFAESGSTTVTVAGALSGSNKKFYQVEKTTPPPAFKDVTSEVGLSIYSGSPASWGDYNNDGLVDMYKGSLGYQAKLWRNNGATFSVAQSGFAGLMAVWGDYDNDGDIDLFSWDGDNPAKPRKLYRNDTGTFVDRSVDLGSIPAQGIFDALWGDWDKDGDIDIYLTGKDGVDLIFWNSGSPGWTFTVEARATSHNGRGVTAADYDGDNDPDIYVSAYYLDPNQLLQNDGFGTFTDVAPALGVANAAAGGAHTIGSAWVDVDNDGDFDLLMANFSHSYNPRHEFFENTGGSFTSRGMCGVAWIEEFINASFFDYDNDGDLDLYYTVFDYISPPVDNNVLYSNNGDWTFSLVSVPQSMVGDSLYSAAWADYDNDGDLDLFTLWKLFRNETDVIRPDNHWLRVKLIGNGATVNKDAIGAEVRIDLGGGVILTRQVEGGAGGGFGNQNDMTLHFGLGSHSSNVNLNIKWPNGATQVVNTAVDRLVTVTQ